MYKCHNVTPLGSKSKIAQDDKGQKSGENEKNKRGEENRRSEKSEEGHCGNKVNLVIRKSSGSKASVYHHIIYQYYQQLIVLG